MKELVGIKIRHGNKVLFLEPDSKELKKDDKIIVNYTGYIYSAVVVMEKRTINEDVSEDSIVKFERMYNDSDDKTIEDISSKEKSALAKCKELVIKNNLEMKLVNCEYSFDSKKILFNFTADDRVDFRNLVKDLANAFHARIELRQIGVRDEAQILGGIGCCGRQLCCKSYLNEFGATSIKMAKDQNLSLNPTKISGICGRLMCCLNNEEDTYKELNKNMPAVGDIVKSKDNKTGEVLSTNILRQKVKVIVELPGDEKEMKEYSADELEIIKRKKNKKQDTPDNLETVSENESV